MFCSWFRVTMPKPRSTTRAAKPSKPTRETATIMAMIPLSWDTMSRTFIPRPSPLFMFHGGRGMQSNVPAKTCDETVKHHKTIGQVHSDREIGARVPLGTGDTDTCGATTHPE